jgi:hypothetical protein
MCRVAFLRVLSLLGLSLWVGGLAAMGFVAAPAIFATLEAGSGLDGRAQAGALFGAVFQRFQYAAWIIAGALIVLFIVRALLGPRPRKLRWRMLGVSVMLACSIATAGWIAPRIDQIRRDTTGAVAALPEDDARRQEFGRLHAWSNGLMLLTLVLGTGLIWIEAKDTE